MGKTGVTVVLCGRDGAVIGADVRGAAPGTREIALTRSENTVERANAVMLAGGSAFGLDAAAGVMRFLEEADVGVDTGVGKVPIVPAAVLFDLSTGNPKARPDAAMDLTVVSEVADYMEREIGIEISPRQPFVGRSFNVTRAGIHADGMLKDEEIYNIFDTTKILNRPATVAVDSHSGLAGVAHWMNSYFRLKGEHVVDKQDTLVVAVKTMS